MTRFLAYLLFAGCTASVQAAPDRATVQQRAHDVMAKHCGECHEAHRATAKPAALAVFDLDRPDWPSRFDAHRFEAGLKRFNGKPDEDTAAFVALRDTELAARSFNGKR
jgi:hypothetical protein